MTPETADTHNPRVPFDRGPRPLLRGWLHVGASIAALIAGIALIFFAVRTGNKELAIATIVYVGCFTGAMGVSGFYHRWPFRHEATVQAWRRADHAMIAVFIAGTYGPVVVGCLAPDIATQLLIACWASALAAVFINIVWINHPRWLAVLIYLFLGWLVLWQIPELWLGAGPTVVLLLAAGGVVYSFGALVYGFKWPNPSPRWFGFHEVFHAATVVAAILHHIAIWIVVLNLQ
ncbi:hemolysin III family protein [Corynebacterium sp. TAE3-ERU12]|uniref:PAQR family membrane homeostasis protein TrhA n=1 Tax=Corynebacterium sp. TAE3-ERU12 TaxID=2849491 RepID=UPI001C494356|nr:hemolysin III family protein [Corynebacterium sp. TAE3-ERU12]MBV7294385.1 hemolysin III family protein [Corynebacterium sp. TAE3-ERU12]